jgi:hypothetical protein
MRPPATAMNLLPPANVVILVVTMMSWRVVRHGASSPKFSRWRYSLPAALSL